MDNTLDSRENPAPLRSRPKPTGIVNSILAAASVVLPRAGYAKSTTNRIALKAGVSIGSLYYYFRSKDAIYQALMDGVTASYLARLEHRLANPGAAGAQAMLAAILGEAVDFTFDNRPLLRTLFALSSRLERMETCYDLRSQFARQLAGRVRQCGGQEPALSETDAFVLVNAVNGILDNYIYSSSCPLDRGQMQAAMLGLVRGIARAAPSA